LVGPEGLERLGQIGRAFTGRDEGFMDVVAAKKRQVMEELFSGQMRRLVENAGRVLGRGAPPQPALAEALVEITARLPVYRTYVRGREVTKEDRRIIEGATPDANRCRPGHVRSRF